MIHGLVVINKPGNMSSHTVVDKIRKLFKVKKAGHFGTLDPMAEGVLLVGMGNATKFFNFYMKKQKQYSGWIKFGYATTTYDLEGEPLGERKPVDLSEINIQEILKRFVGKQLQTPPIYSAKKYKGKPLYRYARENRDNEVEIKPSEIEVYSLKGEIIDKDTLHFETVTSSGTYIRSLAHDIGQAVGVGAFLQTLKRDAVGEFYLKNAYTLPQLAEHKENKDLSDVVTPIEVLLPEFPKIIVTQGGRAGILNGMPLLPPDIVKVIPAENTENFRLFDDEGKLLAIARKDQALMRFKPYIVFNN